VDTGSFTARLVSTPSFSSHVRASSFSLYGEIASPSEKRSNEAYKKEQLMHVSKVGMRTIYCKLPQMNCEGVADFRWKENWRNIFFQTTIGTNVLCTPETLSIFTRINSHLWFYTFRCWEEHKQSEARLCWYTAWRFAMIRSVSLDTLCVISLFPRRHDEETW